MLGVHEVAEITGHDVGGVCPFGLKTPLPVYCDISLKAFDEVVPAAGSTHSAVASRLRVWPSSQPPNGSTSAKIALDAVSGNSLRTGYAETECNFDLGRETKYWTARSPRRNLLADGPRLSVTERGSRIGGGPR